MGRGFLLLSLYGLLSSDKLNGWVGGWGHRVWPLTKPVWGVLSHLKKVEQSTWLESTGARAEFPTPEFWLHDFVLGWP